MSLSLVRRVHVLEIACLIFTLFATHAVSCAGILNGWVYIDRNNDGQLAFADEPQPDFVIPNVQVKLFQLVNAQEVEVASILTNEEGFFSFNNLREGTYSLRQTQPVQYVNGIDTLGSLRSTLGQALPGWASAGVASNNAFTGIVLPAAAAGEMYLFGELGLMPGYISKRMLFASAPPLPDTDGSIIPEPTSTGLLVVAMGIGAIGHRRGRRIRV